MKKSALFLLSVLMATSSSVPINKTEEAVINEKEKVMNAFVYSKGMKDEGGKKFDVFVVKNKNSTAPHKRPQSLFACSILDLNPKCQEAKDRVRMFIYTCIKIILVIYIITSQFFPRIDVAAPEFLTSAAVFTLCFKYLF